MSADALKSASVTNLDAVPMVPNTTGEGAPGYARDNSDYVTPTAAGLVDTGSKYKMIRVPTVAKLKALTLSVEGALDSSTGLALDVGLYYSDSTADGTAVANQGVAITVDLFLAASTAFRSSAVADVNALAAFKPSLRNQPLWQAAGLASDPGGYFDIVVAVHTAATTAASKQLGIRATYVV